VHSAVAHSALADGDGQSAGTVDGAERLQADLAGRPAEWKDRREFAPFSIASVITGLKRADAVRIEAPIDLRVDVIPDPTRTPVQARVRVHWAPGTTALFEAPDRVRVLHAFTRASSDGDVLLHHRDHESKLLTPHLPTPYGDPQPRFNIVDRALPSYGVHTWKIAAMDLFGRVSPDAAVSTDVRDTIPPPSPANVAVQLLGDATAGPSWTAVVVAFDWVPAFAALAPDLAVFEIRLKQGLVSSADAPLPTTWGQLETTPGSTAGPVAIEWPALGVGNVPAGVAATTNTTPLADGGTRITIAISPSAIPFDPATGIGADGRLDLSVLALTGLADGYEVSIDDVVPAADGHMSRGSRTGADESPWARRGWKPYEHKPPRRAGDLAGERVVFSEVLSGRLEDRTTRRAVWGRRQRHAIGSARIADGHRRNRRGPYQRSRVARRRPGGTDGRGKDVGPSVVAAAAKAHRRRVYAGGRARRRCAGRIAAGGPPAGIPTP
jgi:hypothetical protein